MDITIQYIGEYFIISPITFGAARQLQLRLEECKIFSSFGVDTPLVFLTTPDELVGALGIHAGDNNALVLDQLNAYFGVSLPSLEAIWKAVCVSKD